MRNDSILAIVVFFLIILINIDNIKSDQISFSWFNKSDEIRTKRSNIIGELLVWFCPDWKTA